VHHWHSQGNWKKVCKRINSLFLYIGIAIHNGQFGLGQHFPTDQSHLSILTRTRGGKLKRKGRRKLKRKIQRKSEEKEPDVLLETIPKK